MEDLSSKIQTLWSWGSNKFGQLGHGILIQKSMPKPINYLLGYQISNINDVIKTLITNFLRLLVELFILCVFYLDRIQITLNWK